MAHLFLVHRYKASTVHYVSPTDDNRYQAQKMKSHGLFSDVHDEVGQVIVADVSADGVTALLAMGKTRLDDVIDLSKGILEAIDKDSYRVEKKAAMKIQLPDQDAEIEPCRPLVVAECRSRRSIGCQTSSRLSTTSSGISLGPTHADRVQRLITEEIPAKVAADTAY